MAQKDKHGIIQRSQSNTIGKKSGPEVKAYENLANAIVLKAVRDYQHALIDQHLNPTSVKASDKIVPLERFFHSEWYKLLTSIDGDYMIKIAKKQLIDNNWKRPDCGL